MSNTSEPPFIRNSVETILSDPRSEPHPGAGATVLGGMNVGGGCAV